LLLRWNTPVAERLLSKNSHHEPLTARPIPGRWIGLPLESLKNQERRHVFPRHAADADGQRVP
jgi:hypothetical protein